LQLFYLQQVRLPAPHRPKITLQAAARSAAPYELQFNTRTAKHLFCSNCGIKSFYVPRSHPDGFSVNARCLDEGTVERMTIRPADGREWEKMYPEGHGPKLED
jgi:hypothetical protein